MLVLFNVETTRTARNDPTFYPFQLHKAEYWSIEHIQAQNSENFDPNKKKPWIDWIAIHLELLKDQRSDDNTTVDKIIEQLEKVEEENINWDEFQKIFQEVIKYFSEVGDKDTERLHTISNLALLTDSSNSALNNAVFLAKRNKIIDLDKKGHYIPICTKRLFLRYYGEVSKLDQVRFWTALDRKYYFISMLEMLFPYLNDKNKSLLEKLKNNPKDE